MLRFSAVRTRSLRDHEPGPGTGRAGPRHGPGLGTGRRHDSAGRMLRRMTAEVSVKTVESTPTAVVAASATWAEFPSMWGPMLDKV